LLGSDMILDEIVHYKRKQVEEQKRQVPYASLVEQIQPTIMRRRSFKKALRSHSVNIIAEVKKASPSKGIIREDFDPCRLAHMYEFAGASAISILTESKFFQGNGAYVKAIRDVTARPLLRKDFIIDPYQIPETAVMGADAVLLIAAILSVDEMRTYIEELSLYNIDALVEVHTHEELEKALAAGADIIGINNRNLYTFDVTLTTTYNLIRTIPKQKTIVSESGIRTHAEITELRSVGVHAFLIGETILRADDVVNTIHELRGDR